MKTASGTSLAVLAQHVARLPYARRGAPVSRTIIRVVLADDHTVFREGVRLLLKAAPDLAVVGEAGTGAATVQLVERLAPNVVVLDLEMPGSDGTRALREIVRSSPAVATLILTMHDERDHLLPLLEGGARGYLTKEAASSDLIEAIRVVANGDVYVRPTVARMLAAAVIPRPAVDTARARFDTLSGREQSIVRCLAQGYSGAEIARQLDISSKTVAAYKGRIHDKLGLVHRTEYVRFALEAGILIA
jgi:DNA-binding NarL/FixJ family response regulator